MAAVLRLAAALACLQALAGCAHAVAINSGASVMWVRAGSNSSPNCHARCAAADLLPVGGGAALDGSKSNVTLCAKLDTGEYPSYSSMFPDEAAGRAGAGRGLPQPEPCCPTTAAVVQHSWPWP